MITIYSNSWEFSGLGIFRVGNNPGGNNPGGNSPGGNNPGGSFPRNASTDSNPLKARVPDIFLKNSCKALVLKYNIC